MTGGYTGYLHLFVAWQIDAGKVEAYLRLDLKISVIPHDFTVLDKDGEGMKQTSNVVQ